ncbi:SHC SH2 domain-binding protein 1 homolog A-like [Panonychus citri]|uniref:SHC SH2 domain-binding protein 1 homolog A-like n=1 Tax=Panonychus citri TaxID=50023 RepID=UPI0023074775|nr:SHC SH2 domain-binding protein 1 homolog A-like [Panonychus citri]
MFKKRTSFTPHTSSYPPIFKIKLVKLSEIENLYSEVIIGSSPTGKVHECMVKYVTSLIEPAGWRAVWRTTETGINSPGTVCDFIVEVLDVSHSDLEATVSIEKLLYPPLEGNDCNDEERVAITSLLKKKIVNVSLTELYVINENSDEYSVTAVVIEHVRFFYRHIWRPWDDILTRPQIASFVESYLSDRLRLYFEIGSGAVSKPVIDRINYLLDEGARLKARFEDVKKKMEAVNQGLDGGDWGTNEEIAINDFDLYESLRLQMKLEDFDLEMSRLEDPLLRNIMMIVDVPKEMDDGERIHLVAVEFNLSLLEKIVSYLKNSQISKGKSSIPIIFHQDLPSAFSAAYSGDKVLILPGTYACVTTLWITKDISVTGIGLTKEEVILESSDPTGEIFLHCASNDVSISNLTFRTADSSQGLLQVHFGQTHLKDCTLDGGQCRTALTGQLFLTECNIPHAFTLNEPESSIKIKSSNLSDSLTCSRHST